MRDRIAIIDINTKKFKAVSYKQYDENNILQIVITKNGDIVGISNYSVIVNFQLPSGIVYEMPCIIENNTIKVILTKAILNEYGKVIVEIELVNYEQVVTTFSIYLNVEKSINKETSQIPDDSTDIIPNNSHIHQNKDILDQITQEMINTILSTEKLNDMIYQKKEDETLETDNKTVVGAINEVNKKINEVEIGDLDLSNYVSKEELESKGYLTEHQDLSDYVTEEELNNKGYLTEHQDISGKADKAELFSKDYNDLINKPNIPSIEGLASEEYVGNYVENAIKDIPKENVDLSHLATKTELSELDTQVDKNANDITEILGTISEQSEKLDIAYKHSQIEHVQQRDLEGLATENYVTDKTDDVLLELETNLNNNYVSKEELNNKGYLTEHQDLSGYATEKYVDEAISNLDVDVDLSDYVTEEELNNKGYLTEHQDLSSYVTEEELNNKGYASTTVASTTTNGLMSNSDKAKLNDILRPYLLYSSAGDNGTITLSDTIDNYTFVEIIFRNDDMNNNSIKINTSMGGTVTAGLFTMDGRFMSQLFDIKSRSIVLSGNTISTYVEGNGNLRYGEYILRLDANGNPTHSVPDANKCFITMVIGYK